MRRHNQSGFASLPIIVSVLMTCLFVIMSIVSVVIFVSRQDYKNNSDAKAEQAAASAVKIAEDKKDIDFATKEKSPVKTYAGSPTYGTVVFDYPKTYSGYVVSNDSTPLKGIFYPNVVPGDDTSTAYALRVEVVNTAYDSLAKSFDSDVKSGRLTAKPFRAVKVPTTLGLRLDGQIDTKKQGTIVLIPLRDKTLKIWTESTQFRGDFDTYVLPSLSFVP